MSEKESSVKIQKKRWYWNYVSKCILCKRATQVFFYFWISPLILYLLIGSAECLICKLKLGYSIYFWNRLLKAVVLQKPDFFVLPFMKPERSQYFIELFSALILRLMPFHKYCVVIKKTTQLFSFMTHFKKQVFFHPWNCQNGAYEKGHFLVALCRFTNYGS